MAATYADRALRAGRELHAIEKRSMSKQLSEITPTKWIVLMFFIAFIIAELGMIHMLLMRIEEKIAVANGVEKIES